ncbi:ROK family protein [Antrihabitans cavernicola]|uniref:ROK family protein n=1 Tax=Antrihabitans cavernicola TaxID=2495913 RepID=A0A5A7S8S8_9NOCA|nr:ROK family protein [Spelaeibacter cavernicola]KAA0021609.1 ROK family protein [Spelaeibacter cavernicola]
MTVDPDGTVVGVDLGGTKITAGLVLSGGRVVDEVTVATPARQGADAVVSAVVAVVQQVIDMNDRHPIGIGIGSAGVIGDRGEVLAATDHLLGWAGAPLAASVEKATGLRTLAINDVHAHALGEARHGAGRGMGVVLVVAAGTGLGGAVVVDGKTMIGSRHLAGHLGHVPAAEAGDLECACGGRGHLETVSSGPGLVTVYRRAGGIADDARQVVAAAESGDETARAAVHVSGRALGRAIGGWINMIDPDVVVVSGGLAQAGTIWWDALDRGARGELIPLASGCPILKSQLGSRASILGAASLFADTHRYQEQHS